MKIALSALAGASLLMAASVATAQTAPAHTDHAPAQAAPQAPAAEAASAKPSVDTTPIDQLLQNAKAMEILFKHFPEMKGQEDQLAMAGSMTLRDIQPFAADTFTDEKLAAVEADFKAMP